VKYKSWRLNQITTKTWQKETGVLIWTTYGKVTDDTTGEIRNYEKLDVH